MTKRIAVALMLVVFALAAEAVSAEPAKPKPTGPEFSREHQAKLDWWREARFGMFIHWGPVSLKGTEIGWSRGAPIPIEEYDNLYKQFNPTQFDPDEWVRIAKAAGMKYIILTTKHHDGFCMFNTKQTDYNIMNSAYGKDITGMLAAACKRGGIAFGTYHSVADWHNPDFPHGSPGGSTLKPNPNLDKYEQYLKSEVGELIHQYGPLLTMWFDVAQDFDGDRGKRVVDYTRAQQPDILVNNRCANAGDFDTPEQTVGHFQNTRPWESCITICNQWAYKPDDGMKSLKQCLQTLVSCAGGDGNLLFNVGPMPTGEIEHRQVRRLAQMGSWLRRFGDTVYGTRGGPIKPGSWGCSTYRGDTVYAHIFNWSGDTVSLPAISRKIISSRVLTGGTATVKQTDDGTEIAVPAADRKDIDTIVALQLDGPAADVKPVSGLNALTTGKKATASNTFQGMADYAPGMALDDNESTRWATDGGTHSAWLEVDLGKPQTIASAEILESCGSRIESFELQAWQDGAWQTFFTGTTIGEQWSHAFPPVTAQKVRLNILKASEGPTLWEFRLFPPKKKG